MSVPSRRKPFDLSTEQGRLAMLKWLAEADKEVAVFIQKTGERERNSREGIQNGTSPCSQIVIC